MDFLPAPSNVRHVTPRFKREFCVSGGGYRDEIVNSTHRNPLAGRDTSAVLPLNSPGGFLRAAGAF